ncbi:hypothetical protein OF83DRAFT_1062795, partial [Amylostereum chailletii]
GWCGGILGVYLARNNQRTVAPSIIIILTGYAMSNHAQALMISTEVHSMFGWTLMLAGVTRIVEVCFVMPKYQPVGSVERVADDQSEDTLMDGSESASAGKTFRYLPPFMCGKLMSLGRILFMSATDEELEYVHGNEMDHVTYILIMFSISFILYTHVLFLINVYGTSGRNGAGTGAARKEIVGAGGIELQSLTSAGGWYARIPTTAGGPSQSTAPLRSGPVHMIGEEEEED